MGRRPGTPFQVDGFLVKELKPDECQELVHEGRFFDGPARSVPGEPNQCHENARALVAANPAWSLWTGFALSEGCWRVHSWARDAEGHLIETTLPRESYFGIAVQKGQ